MMVLWKLLESSLDEGALFRSLILLEDPEGK
jgi:hypothetical protein